MDDLRNNYHDSNFLDEDITLCLYIESPSDKNRKRRFRPKLLHLEAKDIYNEYPYQTS